MSDELENIEEPSEEIQQEQPQGDAQAETDWKAEARKWEKRAKEAQGLREAAEKWSEYEASLKPEHERLAEQLAAAKSEAESARVTLTRYEVASEKGIPADAIKLLNGSTREELEDAADALLALIANQSKPKSPKPDLNQGKPTSGGLTNAEKFAAALDDIL